MTKPWKLKINSSNILLVLITLILVKAEWANGKEDDIRDDPNNSIEGYRTTDQQSDDQVQVYVGNDEIAQFLFHSSTANASLILTNVNRCLEIFQLLTCLKMLLLETVNNVTRALEKPEMTDTDFYFMNGLIGFKVKNDTNDSGSAYGDEGDESSSLDDEIAFKVLKMFRKRSLRVNLLPKIKIDVEPVFERNVTDFICFNYKLHRESNLDDGRLGNLEEGRGKKGKKGGGSMFMIVPPLLMLGFMPFTLASLKAMVMNAVMINMMALNGAIFMTIRNLVFGPRPGANVQYVNYGYSKNRQTKRRKPTLIIHSPAAFVKQPQYRKKPSHHYPVKYHGSNGHHTNYHSSGPGSSYSNFDHSEGTGEGGGNYQNHIDYDYDYEGGDDYTPGSDIGMHGAAYDHKRRKHTMQKRVDDANQNVIGGTKGYKTINNFKYNTQGSSNKVNPYQRTSTFKPEVRSQSKNQKQSFSYSYWFPDDYHHHVDDFGQSSLKTDHKNPKAQSSGSGSTYKSNSFGVSKKEFKPSPQWDPVIPDNHSFGVNPNSNSNQSVKSDTLNNHNYRNV